MAENSNDMGGIHIGSVRQFINKIESGATVTNNFFENGGTVRDLNDADIAKAICSVFEARTEDGQMLMTDQQQWFAIFKVAAYYLNYPTKVTDFCAKMKTTGILAALGEGVPQCKADSIRKVNADLPQLASSKPSSWGMYASINKSYEKQWNVAKELMEKLGLLS